ncbi:MAG: ethanolamine utilization protein EutJ [Chloroflexota bacterium]
MNPNLTELLAQTDNILNSYSISWKPNPELVSHLGQYQGSIHVGVDLGTAYTVLIVLDEMYQPIAGAYQFAQIVKDGLVVDFVGAVALLRKLKQQVESKLGFEISSAASSYPPGVAQAEVRATANVLYAAGMDCSGLIDEPTAANNVLKISDGAIVDVGGGTTGIAIIRNGNVVYTADEPTGGTHFSLVIAGAKNISFENAEEIKKDPNQQRQLFPVVRPVMEKVGNIIARHVKGQKVKTLYLVGGTCAFPGMDKVVQEYTGIETIVPGSPLFVTPLGIAMHN